MEPFTNIRSLLGALAKAMNLINPELEHHHEQTAYFAYFIGQEMKFDRETLHLAIYASLLHDVGSVILSGPVSVEEIESEAVKYAAIGARMLQDLPEFKEIAAVIALCQTEYSKLIPAMNESEENRRIAEVASAIHVADVTALLMKEGHILNQRDEILGVITCGKGTHFMPEAVEALERLRNLEVIWLDALNNPDFLFAFTGELHGISLRRTVSLTRVMSRIIDYRSSFTAMHSAGVSASAVALAKLSGFDERNCLKMEIAGNLHDVGKLVVPGEILEKPGKLTAEEFNIIKEHAYYTRFVLMGVEGFEEITDWAGFHHEKLNGRGYPFHIGAEGMVMGSRILAVADVFSAIAEERPYRKGMKREQIEKVLRDNVSAGGLDGELVDLLLGHYAEVDDARDAMSRQQGKRYFDSLRDFSAGK